MRPVSAARAAPAGRQKRRPPQPRWVRPVTLGGVWAVVLLVAGGGLWHAVASGMVARAVHQATVNAIALTGDLGLRLEDVTSLGRNRTTLKQLVRALEVTKGQDLLGVDTEAVRDRIEALPWVASASVSRRLPGRLVVTLVEREPVARWQQDDGIRLIDRSGKVIAVRDLRPFSKLPVVEGIGAPARAAALFAELAAEPDLARRITGARLVGERRWNVYVDGRVEIRLPEKNVAAAWSELAVSNRQSALLDRAIGAVDLRQQGRMVIKLEQPAASPALEQGA